MGWNDGGSVMGLSEDYDDYEDIAYYALELEYERAVAEVEHLADAGVTGERLTAAIQERSRLRDLLESLDEDQETKEA